MEKIFEQYKGRKAILDELTGIICGYDESSLIMACDKNEGWLPDRYDIIVTHLNHPNGYYYVSIGCILPE